MDHSDRSLPRQLVAITLDGGNIAVMQFFTRFYRNETDAVGVSQEATDEAIQATIDKTSYAQSVISWRRIEEEELPEIRANRKAWRDDGKKIAVDQTKIEAPAESLEDRIAALEASVASAKLTSART